MNEVISVHDFDHFSQCFVDGLELLPHDSIKF